MDNRTDPMLAAHRQDAAAPFALLIVDILGELPQNGARASCPGLTQRVGNFNFYEATPFSGLLMVDAGSIDAQFGLLNSAIRNPASAIRN